MGRQIPALDVPIAAYSADFTPSRKTWLWIEVLALPQKGTMRSMKSGNWVAHWKVWPAPMDQPRTARAWVIPRWRVMSWCWARMLSWKVIKGKGRREGVLEGEEDCPLPKRAGMMM